MGIGALSGGQGGRGVALNTDPHLTSRVSISIAIRGRYMNVPLVSPRACYGDIFLIFK
jgi:hypothetical protein